MLTMAAQIIQTCNSAPMNSHHSDLILQVIIGNSYIYLCWQLSVTAHGLLVLIYNSRQNVNYVTWSFHVIALKILKSKLDSLTTYHSLRGPLCLMMLWIHKARVQRMGL